MAGLTYAGVRDDLLRKLGFESAGAASAGALADVLAAMNYAQQTLWLAGPDFFTRKQIALTFVESTASYTLADTVQSVLGPVRLPSGRTLRAITSRAEFDNFAMLYLGQTDVIVDDGEPLAYFVENLNQSGVDPVQIKLHVVPAPDSENAGVGVVEGVSECTIFVVGDLSLTTTLPVAQQYVETLFMPLARKAITRSTYFSMASLQEKIDADYEVALAMLRRAGGFPPAAGRKEAREVEA